MKALLESIGLAGLARRIWPRALAELRVDSGAGDDDEPLVSVREPRPGEPLGGRSAGVALEEPRDIALVNAIGRQR
jgi:hypothetical protein